MEVLQWVHAKIARLRMIEPDQIGELKRPSYVLKKVSKRKSSKEHAWSPPHVHNTLGPLQLHPTTQKIMFYDAVARESQELDKKREEVEERLRRLAERREQVDRKWKKFEAYMEQRKPELEAMKRWQLDARLKAASENKIIAKCDEELHVLRDEYKVLLEKSHKLKEQIRGRKHFETFLHDVAMIGCKRHRECGYGNKSLGEIVIGRYNTLSLIKKEASMKHQNQLQEIQDINQELHESSLKHSAYVSMCHSKLADLQRKLERHLYLEGRQKDSQAKKKYDYVEKCKVIDQSLRAIENLYQLCIDNGAKKPIVSADNLEVQLQVIQDHTLYLDGIVTFCQQND